MANSKDTIKFILNDLTSVRENLLALSEDIWNSIDHNHFVKLIKELFEYFKIDAESMKLYLQQDRNA